MSRLGGVKVRGALIRGHIYDPVPVNTARKQMRICLFFFQGRFALSSVNANKLISQGLKNPEEEREGTLISASTDVKPLPFLSMKMSELELFNWHIHEEII